jgi:cobaltochelatase CobS
MTEINDGKIVCKIDGARVHSIQIHIRDNHPDWTIEKYKAEFPGEPLLSPTAMRKIADRAAHKSAATAEETLKTAFSKHPFHEVFGLPETKAVMSSRGTPIMISVQEDHTPETRAYVPDVDPNYVFPIDITKTVIIALEQNMPLMLWGYHGTGKTTVALQTCARTKRPAIRVQHTVNTEEAHVLGQYVVREGETRFQLGPLPEAMLKGYTYLADEYDFAMPSVLSVYQPVLEGNNLVIKDAPPEFRVIRPHPNFRFVATGNTNGVGDETGLYQGTQIQNAANYSRFAITEEVPYMDPKIEAAVIAAQARIERTDAENLVKFAKEIREAFKRGTIGMTVSPRELIAAGKLAMLRGCDWRTGIRQAFTARLSRIDKETAEQFAQRIWA